jgi:hypothetical protein
MDREAGCRAWRGDGCMAFNMQTLALDLRAALRFLERRAGASAVISVTLALALAANAR